MRGRRVMAVVAAVLALALVAAGCSQQAIDSMASSESSIVPSEGTEASPSAEASASPPETASTEATENPSEETSTMSATPDPNAQPASSDGLATPDPMFQTVSVLGTIVSVDPEQDNITIQEDGTEATAGSAPQGQIVAVEAEDCMIVDSQTGAEVDDDALGEGDRVFAFVSPNQTRSIPPQAQCYALITNIPDNGMGIASYVHVIDVQQAEDGNISVLNQNADLWVTIPADLKIEVFDEPGETATAASIRPGTNLIAWYDVVLESYPGQTTATRVMIDD